jgi:hypothetical protein
MSTLISGLFAIFIYFCSLNQAATPPYATSQFGLTDATASLPTITSMRSQQPGPRHSSSSTDSQSASPALPFYNAALRLRIDLPGGYKAVAYPDPISLPKEIIITARSGEHVYINTSDAPDGGAALTLEKLLANAGSADRFSYLRDIETVPVSLSEGIVGFYYINDRIGDTGVTFEYNSVLYEVSATRGNTDILRIAQAIKFY